MNPSEFGVGNLCRKDDRVKAVHAKPAELGPRIGWLRNGRYGCRGKLLVEDEVGAETTQASVDFCQCHITMTFSSRSFAVCVRFICCVEKVLQQRRYVIADTGQSGTPVNFGEEQEEQSLNLLHPQRL